MGDPQFQEFIKVFDSMPQHIKAPQQCYRLVHDIDLDSFNSPEKETVPMHKEADINYNSNYSNNNSNSDVVIGRKRRKLPEIPANKKPLEGLWQVVTSSNPDVSLSQEMANPEFKYYTESKKCLIRQVSTNLFLEIQMDSNDEKPISLKLYNRDPSVTILSPEEDETVYRLGSDSGASSAHSPIVETRNGIEKLKSLQLLDATHRGLYKFMPRHKDELDIEIGDPIYVCKENEDLWCEGINLRTGLKGIFPSALVTDVEYSDFVVEPNSDDGLNAINFRVKKERYLLNFLGSIEVMHHKGNAVLCESVRKVINAKPIDIGMTIPHPSILEISDLGLRMMDRKPVSTNSNSKLLNHDYFFALKHVTFCGYYPEDNRYFGFITKHPVENRLACHIFFGIESTRDVAEAVGRAFHRFYNRFIEMSYPIEEFYFE